MELIKFTIYRGNTFSPDNEEVFVTPESEAHSYLRSYCESNGYDFEEELGTVGEWEVKTKQN